MAWPALDAGRLLERTGDRAPRGMTVLDRTRLTGRLAPSFLSIAGDLPGDKTETIPRDLKCFLSTCAQCVDLRFAHFIFAP